MKKKKEDRRKKYAIYIKKLNIIIEMKILKKDIIPINH